MPVRWDTTKVEGKEMRIYLGVPDKPGPHPGIIVAQHGPSPFERASGIPCPMIGFFGMEDTNPSPDDVNKIDAELTRLKKWHEFHRYNNTGHAFQNFRDVRYRERAARGLWAELLAFFTEHLKRGTS